MSAESLAAKYIAAMEKTLATLNRTKGSIAVSEICIDEIFSYVNAYLEDAKYFMTQKKFETALTSIAYCEGVLDALKLMCAVKSQDIKNPKSA
jgi:hypothetical protein